MIDHVSIGVSDVDAAGEFYDAALSPLGYDRYVDTEEMIGYTSESATSAFFVRLDSDAQPPSSGSHVAFTAPDRAAVDEFHHTAVDAGADDDGGPGLRPEYSDHYYAAYVVDPYGYRIEAVTRQPE
jgi:catechol 2,3-dioxygenase-like lactoylglutathione lyase family enzyme